jgi:hypothetical protein
MGRRRWLALARVSTERASPVEQERRRRRTVFGKGRPATAVATLAPDERLHDGLAMTSVSLEVGVGLICALLSALGTNLAFLFKHRGAVAAPDVDMRHPIRSAVDSLPLPMVDHRLGVAAVAFALHVAALTLARSQSARPCSPEGSSSWRCSPSASSASSWAVAGGSESAWWRSRSAC